MRVVVLSPFLPYPGACHAGADLLLAHLEAFGATHDLALFGIALPEAELSRGLVPASLNLIGLLPYPPPVSHPAVARLGQRLVDWLGWELLPTAGRDLSAMLAPARDHLSVADIIEVHWAGWMAPVIPIIKRIAPMAAIVVAPIDVPWEAAARRFRLGRLGHGRERLRRGAGWLSFTAFRGLSSHLMGHADAGLVLTARDAGLLRRAGIRCPLLVRDPPLECPGPAAARERAARPPGRVVLFTGALGRPENHSGVLWFLDNVWPLVEGSCAGASFVAAGADPPAALRARASASVSVTGKVPSLTPFYEAADVFVAPLLVGSGLKLKVPQAMLHGLPVVATPIAAEGIIEEGGSGVFAAVTDDPDTMARCIVQLLSNPERTRGQGELGRQWALGHYDFDASTGHVLQLYEQLARPGTDPGIAAPSSR